MKLNRIIYHLETYGNTILSINENPKYWQKELKRNGYDCDIRKCKDLGDGRVLGYYYVIEVKK